IDIQYVCKDIEGSSLVFAVRFQAFSSPRVHHQHASIKVRHHYASVDRVEKRSNMLDCQIRARGRHPPRVCCRVTIHASATSLKSGKTFPMARSPSLQSLARLSMVNAFHLHNLGNPWPIHGHSSPHAATLS